MDKLISQRDDALAKAQAIMDAAAKEGRELTPEEAKQVDELTARAEAINKQIEESNTRAARLASVKDAAAKCRAAVVNPLEQRNTSNPFANGQNAKDLAKFSLARALRCLMSRGTADGVEAEVFAEGRKEARDNGVGFDARAIVIPASALRALGARRAIESRAETASGSGSLISSEAYPTIFEMMRDNQILTKIGATVLDGLSGNVKISTQTGQGGDLAPIDETAAATSLDPALNPIELTPKRIAAYTSLSNQLVMQSSPNVEQFAVNNILKAIATSYQKSVFTGAAGSKIVGIPNITGVNVSHVATANAPTWGEVVAMLSTVAGKDFDVQHTAFVLNGVLMATLMSTPKTAAGFEFIMSEGISTDGLKTLAGLKAGITGSTGSDLIFGTFDNYIVGQWAGLGLIYDPYTQAKNGQVEVVAEMFMDGKVGNPANFSVLKMTTV